MTVVTGTTPVLLRSCAEVHGHVTRVCFKTGPPGLVGTELEWLVAAVDAPSDRVPVDRLRRLLDAFPPPGGSRITFEPGGQLELSSPPAPGPAAACAVTAADVDHVRRLLDRDGLRLSPTAVDPHRLPRRQLEHPRYAAMEAHFAAVRAAAATDGVPDVGTDVGPVMMCSTAANQVNLDVGADAADACRRWQLLHDLGPALVAAFANSPVHAGRVTGWRSTRQWVWQHLDVARTHACEGEDPAAGWTSYALDAELMLRRRDVSDGSDGGDGADWSIRPGIPFRAWLDGTAQVDGPPPTLADLDYHLTTLFPPVRPRGWYEVRYVDQQPLAWWAVPTAVLAALLDGSGVSDAAAEVVAPVAGRWEDAARDAVADPALGTAARDLLHLARQALVRDGHGPLADLVGYFAATYTDLGRCPADDALDEEATP